jgi:hypothetical protein
MSQGCGPVEESTPITDIFVFRAHVASGQTNPAAAPPAIVVNSRRLIRSPRRRARAPTGPCVTCSGDILADRVDCPEQRTPQCDGNLE